MAVNKTRDNNNHQKKGASVAIFEADYTDIIADSGSGSIFFVMPPHSIIIWIGLVEEETVNAGANIDITINGDTYITNGPIDASNIFTMVPSHISTGGDFIVKQGGTPPTQGKVSFIIFYVEHDKTTGEYTQFSEN